MKVTVIIIGVRELKVWVRGAVFLSSGAGITKHLLKIVVENKTLGHHMSKNEWLEKIAAYLMYEHLLR